MRMRMRTEVRLLLAFGLLVLLSVVPKAIGYKGRGEDESGDESGSGKNSSGIFLLPKSKLVVRSEAGEVRVVRGYRARTIDSPINIGFIRMEPNSLFIPQYTDSSFIMFIRTGEAKVGWIHSDGLVERELKTGDIYRIPAGSTFYLVNTRRGETLKIISSIDTSESLGIGPYQSFFIGGGPNPTSVLAGFDHITLRTAFNVSSSQLDDILKSQHKGPIVHITRPEQPSYWASFMKLKQQERLAHLQADHEGKKQTKWSWRKLMTSIFGTEINNDKSIISAPESYNIYNRKPDFENNYGWSVALDENDYKPLEHSGIGVYLVNLTAGSMMAPHVNPSATEYGIILSGSGSIQVVFPDGTPAMNAEVQEGDVFWIPRYYPFCQIASIKGPMEFFGFTTSAQKNRPQFLVGASSILQTINGPELATAFDISEKRLNHIINAQRESFILPSVRVSPPKSSQDNKYSAEPVVDPFVKDFADNLFMGFD
ncbi:hypothetical protein IFM89_025521 [Coptis chinensis]|uniref:Cupin type-1 domain-containing protein n=1 Tax=Coptis chinensis TaxID=261450 RepID=A0A835LIK6_9MAGN|nr:hypothetical protein IFM89_025521 [Coptis chinensis]